MNESKLIHVGISEGHDSFQDDRIVASINELINELKKKELSVSPSFVMPTAPTPNVTINPQEINVSPVITPSPVQIFPSKLGKIERLLFANLILFSCFVTMNIALICYVLLKS